MLLTKGIGFTKRIDNASSLEEVWMKGKEIPMIANRQTSGN